MLDVETDAYIHCVSAFVKLAQSEYQLLMDIIPEHHQKRTFDSLIQVLTCSPCSSDRVTFCRIKRVGQTSCPEPSTLCGVVHDPLPHPSQHVGSPSHPRGAPTVSRNQLCSAPA